jgi:ankyrin repeat protein
MTSFLADASMLYRAVDSNDLAEVKNVLCFNNLNLEDGYKDDQGNDHSPLFHALNLGNVDVIKALLDAGASLVRPSVFVTEAQTQLITMTPLEKIMEKSVVDPEFLEAIKNIPQVTTAFSAIALSEPSGIRYSRLYDAVSQRDYAKVAILLALGADPNQGLIETDGSHISPLYNAVEIGPIEMVKILLEYGADPNYGFIRPNGGRHDVPLDHAIHMCNYEAAKILIAHAATNATLVPGGDLLQYLLDNVQDSEQLKILIDLAYQSSSSSDGYPIAGMPFVNPAIPTTTSPLYTLRQSESWLQES